MTEASLLAPSGSVRGDRVRGKVALVTGAGRGIGRAIATTLAREGAMVVATDILTSNVEETAQSIRGAGGEATALTHDVVHPKSWSHIVEEVNAKCARLDILVNNAGRCALGSIEESTLAEWRDLVSVNLDSVFLGLHHCLPLLRASGSASVVNLSSGGGIVAMPGCGAYSAAKGGIRAFSKTAAIEFAQRGYRIRVNSVHPGPTDTDRAVALMGEAFGMSAEAARAAGAKALPLGRLGAPEDIASAVLYLASDESSWVTGSELIVDGGDIAR
jgi:NAD(P)-dependent dehydrogenase (short-subunit alcohol dehydrogenase family)